MSIDDDNNDNDVYDDELMMILMVSVVMKIEMTTIVIINNDFIYFKKYNRRDNWRKDNEQVCLFKLKNVKLFIKIKTEIIKFLNQWV